MLAPLQVWVGRRAGMVTFSLYSKRVTTCNRGLQTTTQKTVLHMWSLTVSAPLSAALRYNCNMHSTQAVNQQPKRFLRPKRVLQPECFSAAQNVFCRRSHRSGWHLQAWLAGCTTCPPSDTQQTSKQFFYGAGCKPAQGSQGNTQAARVSDSGCKDSL